MKLMIWSILISLVLFHHNLCSQQNETTVLNDEGASLRTTDSLFSKLSSEKGTGAAFLAYMDENASLYPAGQNIVTGRENISKHFENEQPDTRLTWKPLQAEVARSGELGYTAGIYEYKFLDNNGHPVYRNGKYVTIWKKQSDGSWKFLLDIGNSTPLPPLK